ncbi:flagellar hook-length control protein FliK [Polynucleobacter sp. UK-FUSCHL-C3]|uniref:Flagellar hook-length control protein FliK n=1 Tax=Polynucleobacter sp. UK-FUSCHL-C3 TaxID=2955208 RepID=A0AAU8A217_9BURK
MSFANAVPSKHQVSQLQAGREPFASKDKLPSNAGGLEDFLNELNQATNLRMQVQEETATDNRLKGKKAPEVKDSKTDPEVQILHKQEQSTQNPANIADSGARSDPAIAKIMAALEQLNQQNQAKAASLLSNWGETASVGKLDLESLRTNLKNLGFESILGDLEKAQAAGNLEQVAGLQANLAEKLLAQLGNLNAQNKDAQVGILSAKASIDAKTLQALEAQRNQITANQTINQALQKQLLAQEQMNTPVAGSELVRVIAVEPSLAQELKMKQAADLDTEFTLTHNTLLGSKAMESVSLDESAVAVEDIDTLVSGNNLLAKSLLDGQALIKTEKPLDKSVGDDFSGNLLSASQVAQSTTVSTPTQIAMSLNEASIVSGPLHSEIMSAAKSGGGRIQLELTPPEQGTIRIDLRIDQSGRAHLIVEGASDAAKARLDQGGQQLKNEFAQMGLNLSLDLRQGDSRFAQNQQFGSDQARFAQPSSSTDRSSMGIGLLSERLASSRFLSDNASGVSGIHLYA